MRIKKRPLHQLSARDQRQVGDLIMTNGHVSIYVGGDRIIEAYSPRVGVRYASVYSSTPILAVLRPIV
ncbi:NlpC/P60 family protein [Collinsella sp. HCP28S3_E9]|uniref:NlpC/P60 family protein n=1 Tax=Collinsella sp. HCP28S3_E9 TaxID=3438924 RepID=UPI003F8A45A3